MPASARRSVYLIETYWLPLTPFCLSSGDAGLVDLLVPLGDQREHLASEVALEGTNGIELGMSLGDALRHVRFCLRVCPEATNGDDVKRAIGGAIASSV